MALPAIGAVFSRLAGVATTSGEAVGGVGKALGGASGKATDLAAKLFIAEKAMGSLAHFASHALTSAIDGLHAAASPFVNLTAKNNPALAEQFAKATEDAYGVVGRLLIPVTQSLTRAMRTMGDIMARVEPVFQPVSEAVGRFVDVSMGMLSDAVNNNAPAIEMFGSVLLTLVNGATKAAKAMQPLVDAISGLFTEAAGAMGEGGTGIDGFVTALGLMAEAMAFAVTYGIKPVVNAFGQLLAFAKRLGFLKDFDKAGKLKPDASALGAGTNTTKVYSSGAAIAEDVQLKALQQGLAGPKAEPPPDPGPILLDTNTILDKLLAKVIEIYGRIPSMTYLKSLVDLLLASIPSPGEIAEDLAKDASDSWDKFQAWLERNASRGKGRS